MREGGGALIPELRCKHASLRVESGRLRLTAPPGVLNHKVQVAVTDLIAQLLSGQAVARVRPRGYDEDVWLVPSRTARAELELQLAELDQAPVVIARDVALLRGQPKALRAFLDVVAVFPGTRIVSVNPTITPAASEPDSELLELES